VVFYPPVPVSVPFTRRKHMEAAGQVSPLEFRVGLRNFQGEYAPRNPWDGWLVWRSTSLRWLFSMTLHYDFITVNSWSPCSSDNSTARTPTTCRSTVGVLTLTCGGRDGGGQGGDDAVRVSWSHSSQHWPAILSSC
jgi:hypothetical protein